jgi:hypothetical protein
MYMYMSRCKIGLYLSDALVIKLFLQSHRSYVLINYQKFQILVMVAEYLLQQRFIKEDRQPIRTLFRPGLGHGLMRHHNHNHSPSNRTLMNFISSLLLLELEYVARDCWGNLRMGAPCVQRGL